MTRISYSEGVWVQSDGGGRIVDWKPNLRHSLRNFESSTVDWYCFAYKPAQGDTVIDIGAGIGAETYYFSKAVGEVGRVISIEAHPKTYLCLKKLCEYNGLTNVQPINIAIGDRKSSAYIQSEGKHISNAIGSATSGALVETATLDSIVEEFALTEIDFVKMNIEGAERLAIQGMTNTLAITREICICCHDFKADRIGDDSIRTRELVIKFLTDSDFLVTLRTEDKRPWVRDHIHGLNRNAKPGLRHASRAEA